MCPERQNASPRPEQQVRRMPERAPRRNLSNLVRDRRGALGLSLRQLATLCALPDAGRVLSHGWIGELENGHIPEIPKPSQLEALATGLQLPSRQVKMAACTQYFDVYPVDVPVPGEPGKVVTVIARHLERMSPEDQQRLVRIAELFADPGGV